MQRCFLTAITAVLILGATFFGGRASAQPDMEPWMFVQTSDGKVWTFLDLASGEIVRIGIPFKPATDEEIMAFPDSGVWYVPGTDGEFTVSTTIPEWAVDRPGARSAPSARVAPPAPATWQSVAKWTGQGSRTNQQFTTNGPWRVIVTATSRIVDGQVCVTARRVSDERLGVADCAPNDGEIVVLKNNDGSSAGTFRMDIRATGGGNWSVEIQHQQ
jgi:hypothetical protein